MSFCPKMHGNISLIEHKQKLTRCDSRGAETAEDEQENRSLHLSNARATCGPIYPGRGCCVSRRTGVPVVVLLGVHVSSCVSSRLEKETAGGLSAAFQHLGQRSSDTSAHSKASTVPQATGNQRPATGNQPVSHYH